jgi:predicted Zn-dependent peptidase
VHAGIDNQKVYGAITLILKELSKAKEELVTNDEFRRAKEFYTGQLKLGLEDTMEHMLWIGETTATLDRTYSLAEIIAEVDSVTRDDLREVAREVFKNDNLNLSLIGPLKGVEEKIRKQLILS